LVVELATDGHSIQHHQRTPAAAASQDQDQVPPYPTPTLHVRSGSGASHLSSYDHRLLNALVLEERAEELAKERAEELWGASKGQSFCGGDVSALESWLMVLWTSAGCSASPTTRLPPHAAAGGLWHLSSAIVQLA